MGPGSFYNHFDKEQLLQAAVEEALDARGELLEQHTAGLDDPAEVFACSFRLTGRLHRRRPELSMVLLHNALALARSDKGLAPRARRDVDAATRAGRFVVGDPELALAVIAGATLCLGQLLHDQPERDDAHATDQITEDLLRMLGVPADEAHRICLRPLPDPGDPAGHEPQIAGPRPLVPTPPGAAHRTAGTPRARAERSVFLRRVTRMSIRDDTLIRQSVVIFRREPGRGEPIGGVCRAF